MAVDIDKQTHPDYDFALPKWQMCRDLMEGQDAVKARGKTYLPLLGGMDDEKDERYQAYLRRAILLEAFKRTIQGSTGFVFRKEPVFGGVEGEAWAPVLKDATLTGLGLTSFAEQAVREVLALGRYGVLVDLANKQQRPKLCGFRAENIRDWSEVYIGDQLMLEYVVLQEMTWQIDPDGKTPWSRIAVPRFRVPHLLIAEDLEGNATTQYQVAVYELKDVESAEGEGKQEWQLTETIVPELPRGGGPLSQIPFVFLGAKDNTPSVDEPPFLAVGNLELDHFRLDADLKNALHLTGLPTPWFAGFKFGTTDDDESGDDGDKTDMIPIGSEYAFVSPEPQAHAGVLQVSDGFNGLRDEKEADEKRMASMGARILEQQPKGVEAWRTVELRHGGDNSALAGMTNNASEGLTRCLAFAATWMGAPDVEVHVKLNTDFQTSQLTPQQIAALVTAWVKNGGPLDGETVLYNFERGEMLKPGDTVEDVQRRAEAELANSTPTPPPAPPAAPPAPGRWSWPPRG